MSFENDMPQAGPSTGSGAVIHADRLNMMASTSGAGATTSALPTKKKNLSEKQKARNKKNLKKRKKIKQAQKAAAPKNKEWKPDPVLEALKKATAQTADQDSESDSDSEKEDTGLKGKELTKEEKDAKEAKEQRKQEKREKREKREERRERRRAEREKAAKGAVEPAVIGDDADVSDDDEEDGEAEAMDEDEKDERDENASASEAEGGTTQPVESSPPPLQAFPLPRAAPAPDAAVLARQGLPKGLEDAVFVDQSLRIPIDELKFQVSGNQESQGLSERIRKRLGEIDVEEFFAVQAAILPHLLPLRLVPLPYSNMSDYLISAPTGSGKTLAYAVPIVEILSQRVVTRLRALIVLPTRDLVVQVRETLEALAKGTGLNIGSVTGQHSFAQEQHQLIADMETPLLGGSSKLDILIATPGRLMDHLASTPNFTLQHLRFLVIDEADRLLNQSFQNWLAQVLAYTRPPDKPIERTFERQPYDHVAPAWTEAFGLIDMSAEWNDPVPVTCQKLLFSATLTRDPSKVAALALNDPKYFIVQSSLLPSEPTSIGEQFAFPSSLTEKMLILPAALKPLNLIHLIHHSDYHVNSALVFTKSVESALRLVKLLEFFEDAYVLGGGGGKRVQVRGYTGEMKSGERKKLLADFTDGKVNLIVCSDLIARGMDLPSVSQVVSYDVPLDMRKYVHRVGRTARAGREGTAWTMIEKQEALHFKGMMNAAGHLKSIRKVKVKEEDLAGYRESYDIAMRRLKEHFGRDA
ncbi:hypothetical protein CI109_105310 [Kwoniella shandongensis]|uniref:ATP-dependent RNA helicase n=1 Tax=Kwoniella shandongensis TaxID=1734106 RepID=A0A5M6BV25_9TREE|nr:uncharacterized protein CI109_004993 [Kwoniella shandongensis]KAA5526603.1 hypothetical protein CI109_004993 [Kwoniella shandongensis]